MKQVGWALAWVGNIRQGETWLAGINSTAYNTKIKVLLYKILGPVSIRLFVSFNNTAHKLKSKGRLLA